MMLFHRPTPPSFCHSLETLVVQLVQKQMNKKNKPDATNATSPQILICSEWDESRLAQDVHCKAPQEA